MPPRVLTSIQKKILLSYLDETTAPEITYKFTDEVVNVTNAVGPNKTRREKRVVFTVTIMDDPDDTQDTIRAEAKDVKKIFLNEWNTQMRALKTPMQ